MQGTIWTTLWLGWQTTTQSQLLQCSRSRTQYVPSTSAQCQLVPMPQLLAYPPMTNIATSLFRVHLTPKVCVYRKSSCMPEVHNIHDCIYLANIFFTYFHLVTSKFQLASHSYSTVKSCTGSNNYTTGTFGRNYHSFPVKISPDYVLFNWVNVDYGYSILIKLHVLNFRHER